MPKGQNKNSQDFGPMDNAGRKGTGGGRRANGRPRCQGGTGRGQGGRGQCRSGKGRGQGCQAR